MSDPLTPTSELTSRDLFAAFAMQAILSSRDFTRANDWDRSELARDAYRVADAMLEIREEKNP